MSDLVTCEIAADRQYVDFDALLLTAAALTLADAVAPLFPGRARECARIIIFLAEGASVRCVASANLRQTISVRTFRS